MPMPQMIDYKIVKIEKDGLNVKRFHLESVNGTAISFKPGQFVNLYIKTPPEEALLFRQFSIASAPSNRILEFCIKILPDGKFTSKLDKMNIGDLLGVIGPFGHFNYDGNNGSVFIAGGTGIAPMMSMLRYIKENKITGDFTIFYTNKKEDMILYYDELKEFQNSGIKIVFTLTQENPESWKGETGRINNEMMERHVQIAEKKSWYCCGPLEFVKIIKEFALGKGVEPAKIKIEGWG
ncbi:MAG: FAD-dependent oxidoreductase [Candidatus Micrarchaeota archaeon]|nr:FAD-dependent oxidoreductase [Candidatus Micrarchaeota archaeon]